MVFADQALALLVLMSNPWTRNNEGAATAAPSLFLLNSGV